mgnify:FL=1
MKVLNFQERIDFVDEVIKMCTIEDIYQPALFDVAFRLTCLKYFIDYDYRSEPQTEWPRIAYESFNLKIGTAGCDTAAFWDQYDSLEKAVHDRVERSHHEYLTLAICNKRDAFAEFIDYLKDYLDAAKENLKDFDVNQASQVMSALLDNKQEISAVLAKDKKE